MYKRESGVEVEKVLINTRKSSKIYRLADLKRFVQNFNSGLI